MDQHEHVATLAALGTLGLAVTGLALGTNEDVSYSIHPGKRKWPGSDVIRTHALPQTPVHSRRTVSQPVDPTAVEGKTPVSSRIERFKRKVSQDILRETQDEEGSQQTTISRASSRSRRSILRPWTAETKSSDHRDVSSGSSWLKRMSSLSSTHGSSPASSIKYDNTGNVASSPWSARRPPTRDTPLPNKLVKRATSQRALSYDHTKSQTFRRPATSHQRTHTFGQSNTDAPRLQDEGLMNSHRSDNLHDITGPTQVWRPFFESVYPRKRRHSEVFVEVQQIRTISNTPYRRFPTLLLGSMIERPSRYDDTEVRQDLSPPLLPKSAPSSRHKLRRSMNSIRRSARRRNFTDPGAHISYADNHNVVSPAVTQSPLSPMSHTSTFEIELPRGTPVFNSSPPVGMVESGFTFRKPNSLAHSDPQTTSSDNDRVFSDDDSIDFRSDTAYDSIATRATSASHSGLRISKLETIFAEQTSDEIDGKALSLESLMHKVSIEDHDMPDADEQEMRDAEDDSKVRVHSPQKRSENHSRASTPMQSSSSIGDEMAATPIPLKPSHGEEFSSPALLPVRRSEKTYQTVGEMIDDMDVDSYEEEIEWSPEVDAGLNGFPQAVPSIATTDGPIFEKLQPEHIQVEQTPQDSKRSSLFDWSEQQQQQQQQNGNTPRPKTVHGNQGNENRSRSSGRKEMHLRSQSVPVTREVQNEDAPHSTSKYGTWGLGHKPVSEEWSDDFDFDDVDESKAPSIPDGDLHIDSRDSIRSVKVPQAIIDRQASVHLQFGQVQEFMLLVEELKRLRAKGLALQLLDSNSKQLWEDADSIINLATINEEEDELVQPASPTSSDIFTEDFGAVPRTGKEHILFSESKRHSGPRRSVSNSVATPLVGRARGESLAQAKNFLQNIHQKRGGVDSSPREIEIHQQKKLPFDTQDLRDLVVRSGVITRALKEIVRKAEGVTVSPQRTPPKPKDPPFSHIFNVPEERDVSPCPPFRKPGLPKSKSANSYLESSTEKQIDPLSTRLTLAAMV